MPTLIVFSHLRWNFVYQRPQHLLSRMSEHCRVLFMEEPVHDDGEPYLERVAACPGVEVLRPHTPLAAGGYDEDQMPMLRRLLEARIAEGVDQPVYAWVYTPMAMPLVETLAPAKVIYDCMDELTHFRNAPPQLAAREQALLERADVVFCGGLSLYRAREHRHGNVHCFPSSVDAGHFAPRARGPEERDPHGAIPRPRLGYCGVLDERMDLALVADAAAARPDWQFVLVGPVAKIDPSQIPALPNVHHYGQQPYQALPRFMAEWDVAIMPFALNDATRYISPTKTLEYLAAERPVVSTPVPDVVASYQGIVELARTTAEFVAACERVLSESTAQRATRRKAMAECVSRTSWDDTVRAMWQLIASSPARPVRAAAGAASVGDLASRRRAPRPPVDEPAPVAKLA